MSRAALSTSLSSASSGRRLLLLGAAGLGMGVGLGGCGFRPLHGSGGGSDAVSGADPEVRAILAATEVALIPERDGQRLRRILQERLGRAGSAVPQQELRVGLQFGAEPEGFRRDGVATRVRLTATANWLLASRATPPVTMAQGVERTFDSFNIPDTQFFAADVSNEAARTRLLEQLADDILLRLTVALRTRQSA